jgi:hypothetical protein
MKQFRLLAAMGLSCCSLTAATFDTDSLYPSDGPNYWPWGDADNLRYQLWFSDGFLEGYSGTLQAIRHFAHGEDTDNLGTSSYTLEIFASTTVPSFTYSDLTSSDLELNHGADKTLIFSGSVTSAATFELDVDDLFSYTGTGGVLLDYVFGDFSGVVPGDVESNYDGPTFQAVYSDVSENFARVTSHNFEGSSVLPDGMLRTQLDFGSVEAVPEVSPLLPAIAVIGLGCLWHRRRNRR